VSSYIFNTVRPSAIQNWVAANAPGSLKKTPMESWRAYLVANGGVGKTIADLELSFLKAQGQTAGTMADQWSSYLTASSGKKGPEKARNNYK
jgi:RecA-family ATPase